MRTVVTQQTVADAVSRGLTELPVAPGTIVTALAREAAQEHAIRLVRTDDAAAPAEARSALREAVILRLGHAPEGLEAALAKVLGSGHGATGTPPGRSAAPQPPPRPPAAVPEAFVRGLADRARRLDRTIVLCEGEEERVLRAAGQLLRDRVCRLTLLGDRDRIRQAARRAGVQIDSAEIIDPATSHLRDDLAAEYARLRAHKAITEEQSRGRLGQVAYFGTMLVAQGLADGMVSGAVHTTAETIRPALEVIRTADGVSSVSSALFLVLADRVLVFADCAVIPQPSPHQLAETAAMAARTAAAFGLEPRVAMLSYSTGSSGSGPDVEKVVEATRLARERGVEVDGPLQYDAAVDPEVAARKLPQSRVAGRATVLVFPDLDAGNIAYKAVQQSSGALAVGPLLLGLRKPVNDLSRGATVDDIVNTVAVTAIQSGM